MQSRSHLVLKVKITKTLAKTPQNLTQPFFQQYAWLDFSIIILALASLFFTWKYIYEVGVLYDELKLKYAVSSTGV